jgi:adenylate cyclase
MMNHIMRRRTNIKIKQLLTIIWVWLLVGFFITVYDHLVLNTQFSLGPSAEYSFYFSMAMNMGSALIGALLGGSYLVFYVNVKYQNKPYWYTIAAVSISYILIIAFIIIILGIVTVPIKTGKSILHPDSQVAFNRLLSDTSRIKNTMFWFIIVALTQLFLQMNSKFGYGVFWNILRGKYNTPKEEKRIFMSLDLNSSTEIAEKLGNEKYHELLKDFFNDITNPVIDNKGEVYQYVGDEVVIAWKFEDGIADSQCIKCFFEMKSKFEMNKAKYIERYGFVPSFKAGIHWGEVVVGEVGIIKRDITFSGDVMNTTSRIRNKCKEFKVDVIASADLLGMLNLKNYLTKHLGAIKLHGKKKEVFLVALIPKNL